jgi:hypothetical protein
MSHGKQIASTTLAQLGGQRFITMTGASSFSSGDDGTLSFRLPPETPRGIRGIQIKLDWTDTYTIIALRMKPGPEYGAEEVERATDVYNDNLQEVFTRITGLYTRL